MSANEIHVGDIGTSFQVTLYDSTNIVDISGATTKTLYFLKPDGTTKLTKTASFLTDGTDGILEYLTISGDLDVSGTWKIQAKVVLPSGEWSSDIGKFKVYDNIY